MALFQKQPITNSSAPNYTLGASKTVLIVGLGNPGKDYEQSRHNVGFGLIDEFARANNFPAWTEKKDLKSQLCLQTIGDSRVMLAKPQTFMNNIGEAVSAIQRFYRVYNSATLVVYDELALPLGQLRSRLGGSDAGHNGVKSLIQYIGEDFGRLRIGIGPLPDKIAAEDFVLGKFNKSESELIEKITPQALSVLSDFIVSGHLPHDTKNIG